MADEDECVRLIDKCKTLSVKFYRLDPHDKKMASF